MEALDPTSVRNPLATSMLPAQSRADLYRKKPAGRIVHRRNRFAALGLEFVVHLQNSPRPIRLWKGLIFTSPTGRGYHWWSSIRNVAKAGRVVQWNSPAGECRRTLLFNVGDARVSAAPCLRAPF